jgi:hypothetical protein
MGTATGELEPSARPQQQTAQVRSCVFDGLAVYRIAGEPFSPFCAPDVPQLDFRERTTASECGFIDF